MRLNCSKLFVAKKIATKKLLQKISKKLNLISLETDFAYSFCFICDIENKATG